MIIIIAIDAYLLYSFIYIKSTYANTLLYLLRYVLPITDLLMLNLVYFAAFNISILLGKFVSYELLRHYVLFVINLGI